MVLVDIYHQLVCTGNLFELLSLSMLNSAPRLALAVTCFCLVWPRDGSAQESPNISRKVSEATAAVSGLMTNKDLSTPQSILTIYINNLNLPGWEPQPFYMWTQVVAATPAITAAPTSPTSPAATASPISPASPAAPALPVAPTSPVTQAVSAPGFSTGSTATEVNSGSFRSANPFLPGRDSAREAILAEYRLNDFFRKTFKRGQRYIYIDVYNFQNSEGAYGAYNYLRRGSTTVLPRGDVGSEDDDSISFVQGKTFLSIYGTSHDDDESKEVLSKVASQAVQYMGDKGVQPDILNRLPRLDLVHGSEKIVMGPNSVKRFFPAPYLNSLGLDHGPVVGCVADYQMQEPAKERLKLMVLTFKTSSEAAERYKNFLTEMGVARNDGVSDLVNQPINVFKSGSTYLAIEQRGPDLLMIIGARKRFSPALVLRQVP